METTTKLKDINEVLAFLCQQFPECFKQKEGMKPLKVGIFKDIAEHIDGSEQVSKTQIRQALRKYTSHWRYLEAVTKSEYRVDLQGEQAEKLEQEHIEHAQKALEESRAKMLKRKKAAQANAKDKANKSDKKRPATGQNKKSPAKMNQSSKKAETSKRSNKVEPLPQDQVKVNTEVKVKLGQALVKATITEVNKDDVHVQLVTGMQVKTKADSLYLV